MKKGTRILRRAALLFVLAAMLSTVVFAADGGFAKKLEQRIAAVPSANRSSVWRYYNDALAKQGAGDWDGAVTAYAAALRYFAAHGSEDGNDDNEINAYRQIAECYTNAGSYGLAAAAYRAAARKCEAYLKAHPDAAYKIQDQVNYERSAAALETKTELYLKTNDPAKGSGTYFGVSGEPVNGLVPGAYAETDKQVHEPYGTKRYWNEFPTVTGVDAGVYLIYLDYGMPLSRYQSHVKAAKEKGFAIELALQPRTGLAAVHGNDGALIQLAKDVEQSGVQFYIRFAGEMNDPSGGNNWYTTDTAEYIRAFRAVADAFHTYAPSAAVVWAPNFYPDYNIDSYYPGDAYVDMVGISLYMSCHPELNPLGTGEENRRWIDGMDAVYSRYGSRKPIMITEGAVSVATGDGRDLSAFAAEQLRDLFLYLPIRYPNVKLMVWFDASKQVGSEVYNFLTSNKTVLDAYRQALRSSQSVLSAVSAPAAPVYYGRLTAGSGVADGSVTLCSYVKGVMPIASVRYSVNGAVLGESRTAPYEITANLAAYRGQSVNVTIASYYADGTQAGEDTVALRVAGTAATGKAFARTYRIDVDGKPVTLATYAIKDEKGDETNYVGLRDLASVLSGTSARFNVAWDGVAVNVMRQTAYQAPASGAAKLTGDRVYRVNTAETRIDGASAELDSIVLTDGNGGGYVYYQLRNLGQALGVTVGWSFERGIYIDT